MTYTRKQVVTCLSVLYLIIATGLAGYASSRANARSVPISDTLTGFVTALPFIAGLFLECGYDLTRRQERRQHLSRGEIQRPPLVIIANTIIFIYSSVVITLLGTHAAPPSGLDCGLRGRWQTLFKQKDADAIRKIQDAFKCCGFANSRDMAWPFPDRSHDQHACESAFGRTSGCLGAWKAEEQQIAGLLIGVVGMVFIWQFAIIAIPTQRESWLHRVAPDRISRMIADERHGGSEEPRRAIDYVPGYNRYSDRVQEEDEQDDDLNSRRAIEEGNRRLTNALPGPLDRDQQPTVENEWARA
ncbi:uncharacterized protein K460DRAFT_39306 [Cucurbitaria berberidis CBS 394.84]|uniref:Tetraspanin Tsp3 n=1 Tax=Cucurbitaria berberidis CBS 394.84 TaxID=1168544 RepID=A0A9P4GTX6_9PLEO|nr:uncharacterized protein K460DRAFT_39306 [Cucurbitaria berberidis CBS 394.84]KAF1851685.1 hypothetical protein K460DRAFT_39306 [Cucurbitaria berberidis CBS 394.84]